MLTHAICQQLLFGLLIFIRSINDFLFLYTLSILYFSSYCTVLILFYFRNCFKLKNLASYFREIRLQKFDKELSVTGTLQNQNKYSTVLFFYYLSFVSRNKSLESKSYVRNYFANTVTKIIYFYKIY